MFKNYKDSFFNDEVIIRSQQRFRSDHHRVYTEKVNKIALSSNDDKRIHTYDKITTYPYGTNVFKICENEMLLKNKFFDRLNNEAQVPKNKSQVIRDESQALTNESQELINESQALRNNSQATRNNSHLLINQSQALINESQELINQSQAFTKKSKTISNNANSLINESQALRNDS